MNEPVVTTKIVIALNKIDGCFAKKRHSGKFQSGDPDVVGCFRGMSFFIEVKMISGGLTLLQASKLEQWRKANALTAMAIYDPKEKMLSLVTPDTHEPWSQFVGGKRVEELYYETVTPRLPLRDYDFLLWLEEKL